MNNNPAQPISAKTCLTSADFQAHRFLIPYYQRAFAWGALEIGQLLNDIYGTMEKDFAAEYYIGNIVCSPPEAKGGGCKIIDGQQRLTVLFLLVATLQKNGSALLHEQQLRLSYLAREKDNAELLAYARGELAQFEHAGFETARQVIQAFLDEKIVDSKAFLSFVLNKVCFVWVTLPEGLDYAEYFEVMNTHVMQLEKHQVLKALMLSRIADDACRKTCAAIWDACSQMDQWIDFGFGDVQKMSFLNAACDTSKLPDAVALFSKPKDSVESEGRVGSIINFPTFLLLVHALQTKAAKPHLDDKQLLETIWGEKGEAFTDASKAKEFIHQMLYWRILFDQFIIKGIWEDEDKARWLIRPLVQNENSAKASRKDDFAPRCRMLQAMLHVAGIPKKDWLLPLLAHQATSAAEDGGTSKLEEIELAIRATRLTTDTNLDAGTRTPHYPFFVLDYLLWSKYENTVETVTVCGKNYNPRTDFVFRFQNSVEHIHPQSTGGTDDFGNLALISKSSNSSYRDQDPAAKRQDFAKRARIESMKLLEVYRDDKFAAWQKDKGAQHSREMKTILGLTNNQGDEDGKL